MLQFQISSNNIIETSALLTVFLQVINRRILTPKSRCISEYLQNNTIFHERNTYIVFRRIFQEN